jgi:hypothetical protein
MIGAKLFATLATLLYGAGMRRGNRRTATKVRSGRVQKNNWTPDRHDFHALAQDEIRLVRNDPGVGHRHVLSIPQLRRFIGLLPDWDEVAIGLDAIVLDAGRDDAMTRSDGRLV